MLLTRQQTESQKHITNPENSLKFLPARNFHAEFLQAKKQKHEQQDLGKESDGAEEGEPQMGASSVGFNGGLVLDDPEGEVDGDPLVPEEIEALSSGVRLQQIPEVAADSHCFH